MKSVMSTLNKQITQINKRRKSEKESKSLPCAKVICKLAFTFTFTLTFTFTCTFTSTITFTNYFYIQIDKSVQIVAVNKSLECLVVVLEGV